SVLIFKRVAIEKFGDHPLLCAVKLGVAYLYTGIQPDNKIIQVKPKAGTGADGQLPEKTIELKFTPGVQFVFINSPNVSEICKRRCFEFGAKNIIHHLETVLNIPFQFNFTQLIEIAEIKAQTL